MHHGGLEQIQEMKLEDSYTKIARGKLGDALHP